MMKNAGYFPCGLPYNRIGTGLRPLVVFQGLMFENAPLSRFMARSVLGCYDFLGKEYTVFIATRKPGLPEGYTLREMANDYARMIREEFGGPVDVIGLSTGGSIAHHFASDHPELVRRLVIHSSACVLSDSARTLQRREAELARGGDWRGVSAEFLRLMVPRVPLSGALVSIGSALMCMKVPDDPSDYIATIEAEDSFDFTDRLHEIAVPTMVAGGTNDPFYPAELFRRTAEGIPNARLGLYEGQGHPASGKRFEREVTEFLLG